jgi:hypothetical protein
MAKHLRPVFQAETEMIPLRCAGHAVAYRFMHQVGG